MKNYQKELAVLISGLYETIMFENPEEKIV
jgi:hypothetical protein